MSDLLQKALVDRDREDIRIVLGSPAGARFLAFIVWTLLGLERPSLRPKEVTDLAWLGAREGRRMAAAELLEHIASVDPELQTLVEKAYQDQRRDARLACAPTPTVKDA